MTTTITPSAGAAPLFTQQGQGTTPGYAALDDRRANLGSLQEGVYGTSTLVTAGGVSNVVAADFMVTQRAAGANMSVDINMPAGGFAFVQGDTINGQGLYCVPVHSANINESIAAADATNPRVDQIILEIQDNVLDASGGNLARTRVLTGSPTALTTLTTRAGAAALPGNALLLADVLVGNGVSSLANSVIRDRRKWTRGNQSIANGSNGGNFTTTSTTFADISATFDARLECSGTTLEASFIAIAEHSAAGGFALVTLMVDGVEIARSQMQAQVASGQDTLVVNAPFAPSAGSHLFQWFFALSGAGTATIINSSGVVPHIRIHESVRQSTPNNTVTTG